MDRSNFTQIQEFILVGFSLCPPYQYIVFVILLIIFLISLLSHTFIILLYRISSNLQTPMYFFHANFSFLNLCLLLTITPKMLIDLLSQNKIISFYGCAVQMNCYLSVISAECYTMASVAYDRYNAICHPLLYNIIMRKAVCIRLVIGSWLIGTINAMLQTNLIFSLPFCSSNRINNFYCELPPILSLACNNTHLNEILMLVITFIIVIVSLLLIVISYANIIWTILKHHTAGTRKKAFSTCSSHLMVVSISYGTGSIMYLRPRSRFGMDEEKILSLVFAIIDPFLNPFIYCFRNNDVKIASKKLI